MNKPKIRVICDDLGDLGRFKGDPRVKKRIEEAKEGARRRLAAAQILRPEIAEKLALGQPLSPDDIAFIARAKEVFNVE